MFIGPKYSKIKSNYVLSVLTLVLNTSSCNKSRDGGTQCFGLEERQYFKKNENQQKKKKKI